MRGKQNNNDTCVCLHREADSIAIPNSIPKPIALTAPTQGGQVIHFNLFNVFSVLLLKITVSRAHNISLQRESGFRI